MNKGELRQKIMDECPDEFSEELGCWIDDLENLLHSALDNFDVKSVQDLHRIEDAQQAIEDIRVGLY